MAVNWRHWKYDTNIVSIGAARYTLVKPNGKLVHANKREIIKLCQEYGVSTVIDRMTKTELQVDLKTGKFAT